MHRSSRIAGAASSSSVSAESVSERPAYTAEPARHRRWWSLAVVGLAFLAGKLLADPPVVKFVPEKDPTIRLSSNEQDESQPKPPELKRAVFDEQPAEDNEPKAGHAVDPAGSAQHKDPEPHQVGRTPEENAIHVADVQRVLTPQQDALRDKLKKCLHWYYQEPITTVDYSPWGVMHALIAFGVDTHIYADGQLVNATGWICYNGRCKGLRLFDIDEEKGLLPREGIGLQGHPGQLAAMLAQTRVRSDFPIKVGDRNWTVADLLAYEKATCRPKTELTFKLIALVHYFDTEHTWQSNDGDDWNISRLIREEMAQPIVGATCGGNHRLTGFTFAVQKRLKEGKPLDGQFKRADIYLRDYMDYIFKLQNPDGSFSTNWYAGRGDWGGIDRKLETTGHMLEWLVKCSSDEQLADARVLRAVNFLTDMFFENRGKKWSIGPRGHGLHALVLYDERVYGARPGERRLQLAAKPDEQQEK